MTAKNSGGRVTTPHRRQKSATDQSAYSAAQYPTRVGFLRVIADRQEAVARSGRMRLILIIRCPFCTQMHAHQSKPDFEVGQRSAACGQGKYELVVSRALAGVA